MTYSFKTTCISQGFSNTGKLLLLKMGRCGVSLISFWQHIVIDILEPVIPTNDVTFSIIYMLVVFTFFTMYSTVSILHEVIRPRTIPPFWFGGVTNWYQSFVYSEFSISTHKRYTNYKHNGIKIIWPIVYTFNKKLFHF